MFALSWSRRMGLMLLLVVGALSHARSVQAKDDDPWLGHDKVLHFSVSVALGAGGYGAAAWVVEPRWQRALLGGAVALAAGGAKELYDLSGRGDPSWRDLTWDVLGSALGVGVGYLMDRTVSYVRERRVHRARSLSGRSLQTTCLGPTRCVWSSPSDRSSPPALLRW